MAMSTAQRRYACAKAAFDVVQALTDAEKAELPPITAENNCPAQWDPYTQAEYRNGYWATRDALLDAEKDLIAWAQGIIKARSIRQYHLVANCFEKPIWNDRLRQQLVDLCFRLDTSK